MNHPRRVDSTWEERAKGQVGNPPSSRMPVNPNVLERLLWLRLNRAPGPFLDLFSAAGFRAATIALELGVFRELSHEPRTPTDLAQELDLDERGLEVLLRFLDPMGYVSQSGDEYEVTPMTRTWLAPGDKTDIGPWLRFWDELVFPYWEAHLEEVLREGEPPRTIYEWFDEEPTRWQTAQQGFLAVARLTAPEVVDRISLPDETTSLLDVGGGHGYFSKAFCQENPDLSATVFDSSEVESNVRETATSASLGDRLTFTAGDYFSDDLPNADVALLFNVIHAHTPAENLALLKRVRAALSPAGRIVVMDQFEDSSRFSTVETALGFVALTYLVTLGGQTYPGGDVESWLREAGFGHVRRTNLRRAPGVSLFEADVAATPSG